MGEVEERLSELGAAIADADSPDHAAIAAARRRLLDGTPKTRTRQLRFN